MMGEMKCAAVRRGRGWVRLMESLTIFSNVFLSVGSSP